MSAGPPPDRGGSGAAGPGADDPVAALLSEGQQLQQAGRVAEARERYLAALARDPRDGDALHMLAIAELLAGRLEEAEARLATAIDLYGAEPDFVNTHGRVLLARGRRAEAIACFRQALADEPQYADARYNLAGALHLAGEHAEAVEHYRKVIAAHPSLGAAHLGLVEALTVQGNRGEALAALRAAARDTGEAALQVRLGATLREERRLSEAESVLSARIAADPTDARARFQLALVYSDLGRNEDVLAECARVIEAAPDHVDARILHARALAKLGRMDEARQIHERALARGSDPGVAHAVLAAAYAEGAAFDAAARSYGNAIEAGFAGGRVHALLGEALEHLGRYEEALASYEKAVAAEPQNAVFHNLVGGALRRLRRYEDALVSFHKAIELYPGLAGAHGNIGAALVDLGRPAAALDAFQRALELTPGLAELHRGLAVAQRYRGDQEGALASLDRALALDPDDVEAHFTRGEVLLRQGALREGWREYQWRARRTRAQVSPEQAREARSRWAPLPSERMPIELAGRRVLLVPEQGIGDEVFFLRFVPAARRRAAWIGYVSSLKLAPLLARLPVFDQVFPLSAMQGGAEEPGQSLERRAVRFALEGLSGGVDEAFAIGDLPFVMSAQGGDEVPAPFPLVPVAQRVAAAALRLERSGPGPYLGVTWRAGMEPPAGLRATLFKHVPLRALAGALASWRGQIVVLQRQPKDGEIAEFSAALGRDAHDFSDCNEDLESMLALLSLLHDYVAVSNTNVHLRAGLGRPCRVLVPHPPEWRWRVSGDASPWFPGFPLYRQAPDGDWERPLARLAADVGGK